MKDSEIIKALKICSDKSGSCRGCPLYCSNADCINDVKKQAIALINRQKAEIERLSKEQNRFAELGKMYSEIKSEAIKEFAERLEDEVTYYEDTCGVFAPFVDCRDIDSLVKEMVGENNA